MAHLAGLPGLRTLWLGASSTDPELAGLMALWLDDTRPAGARRTGSMEASHLITDAGIDNLKGLSGLQWLRLITRQSVTPASVGLRRLGGLRSLTLVGARITDAGLAELKGFTASVSWTYPARRSATRGWRIFRV